MDLIAAHVVENGTPCMAELKVEVKPIGVKNVFDVYVNQWVIGYIQYVEMSKKWCAFPNGLHFRESNPRFGGACEYKTQEEARDCMVVLFKQRLKSNA